MKCSGCKYEFKVGDFQLVDFPLKESAVVVVACPKCGRVFFRHVIRTDRWYVGNDLL